jgi:hypothetical protein
MGPVNYWQFASDEAVICLDEYNTVTQGIQKEKLL